MTETHPSALRTAAEIAAGPSVRVKHPWNPASDVRVTPLSEPAGLARLSVSLARVPPGKESFVHHSHERAEEFLYVLSGRGRAEIGEEVVEVGPGDFMGFPAPGVSHHLTNPYEEDLVYLMAGERVGLEVAYFPRLKRRIVFAGAAATAFDEEAGTAMPFELWLARDEPQAG